MTTEKKIGNFNGYTIDGPLYGEIDVKLVGRFGDLISLNDLWIAAGSPNAKDPRRWMQLESSKEFIESLCKNSNVGKTDIIKSKRGNRGGTYGNKQVALEYAKYIDPQLAIAVNEVFFERVEDEQNPENFIERAKRAYKRKGKTDEWTAKRFLNIDVRNDYTCTLAQHGVLGKGYSLCTNTMYIALFGCNANGLRNRMNISKSNSIRDNMTLLELSIITFAEALASNGINLYNAIGNYECAKISRLASNNVHNAIEMNKKDMLLNFNHCGNN